MTIPLQNGVYEDVPRETYDSIERVHWSALSHMRRSPKHYRANLDGEAERDTDAFRIGCATHVAILEPQRFRETYSIWDGGRRYGKEWDRFQALHSGLEILTQAQFQLVQAISDAVRSDATAAKYLTGAASEVSMLWTYEDKGEPPFPPVSFDCKARVDIVNSLALGELKTTRDASPMAFERQAWNLDYLGQAAFYSDAYTATHNGEVLPYFIIAVEKEPPFAVQVYRVPEEGLAIGRKLYRSHLRTLAYCRYVNKYPGYAEGELELGIPRWAQASLDNDISHLDLDFEATHA